MDHVETELAPAGSGERARQLNLWPEGIARALDLQRIDESDSCVDALGPHPGTRLCKALPPYLKWPIWRAKPAKNKRSAPMSMIALQQYLEPSVPRSPAGSEPHLGVETTEIVKTYRFEIPSIPRVGIEIRYNHGELSSQDRRIFLALNDRAIRTHATPDPEFYEITVPEVLDLVGLQRKHRDLIPPSLWRMAGTGMRLTTCDQLANGWGTSTIQLLPSVSIYKSGRTHRIRYDMPAPTKKLMGCDAVSTVDMHRMQALGGSSIAEALYLLLYDLSQWYKKPSITYNIADLGQRVGSSPDYMHQGRSGEYRDWASLRRCLLRAVQRVYDVLGILRDFSVTGTGHATEFTFFFAANRRLLPPSNYDTPKKLANRSASARRAS